MPAWTLAAALVTLRREVDAAHPARSKASDGTLGDAAHAARESDHNPDTGGVVRAWDCTSWFDPATASNVADDLAEHLRAGRDPRVKYVIRRSRIFSSEIQPWTWRPYSGTNPHDAHVHVSVQPHPSGDDGSPWHYGVDVPLTGPEKTEIAQLAATATVRALLGALVADAHVPGQTSQPLGSTVTETHRWAYLASLVKPEALAAIQAGVDDLRSRPTGGTAVDVEALAALLAPLLAPPSSAAEIADVIAARLAQ